MYVAVAMVTDREKKRGKFSLCALGNLKLLICVCLSFSISDVCPERFAMLQDLQNMKRFTTNWKKSKGFLYQ